MKSLFKIIICTIFMFSSCNEDVFKTYTNDEAPGKVTVKSVENGAGRARINFNLPDSKSLLYIEAVYEDKGKTVVSKASSFNSYIDLEGFSESKDFTVKLYSVSRGMNKSEPLEVVVKPETPPYLSTYEAMVPEPDFGGFNLNFQNNEKASLAVFVEKFNTVINEWEPLDSYYYQDPERTIFVRNQEGSNLKYRLRVRDKFMNYSEYKEFTISPWVESEMNYDLFTGRKLDNDPTLFLDGTNYQPYNFLWNQIYLTGSSTSSGAWIGTATAGFSQYMITFDMGKTAKLTRIVIFQRGLNGEGTVAPYSSFNLKDFEIYGSNDPKQDGSWDSWTKILSGTIVKPAGTAAEVREIAKKGDAFTFDKSVGAYRYLRLKQVTTFSSTGNSRFFLAGIRLFENSNY